MLSELHVKNVALIDEAEVNFGRGLNILTGETGAGKSILLGSVNLALGQKMSKELLRQGTDSCLVELVFQVENQSILQQLAERDVETEDGQLIITRKYKDGRSIFRLNGETCTASKIREISGLLLDIHGQHEHQKLLYPENQLDFLDAFGGERIEPLKKQVEEDYKAYTDVRRELKSYEMDDAEKERERSFLEFEIQEIEAADLKPGEDEELEKKFRRMTNSRKIVEALNEVYQLTDSEEGAGDRTGRAVRELGQISSYDEGLSGLLDSITDIDNLLNDFNREVRDYLDAFTFSEEEYAETEKRLDQVNNLKAKYGRSIEAVLQYLDSRKNKLSELEHFDERKAELEKQLQDITGQLEKDSERLSDARKREAGAFSEKIRGELADLNFLSTAFEIAFTRTDHYSKNGFDAVEYRISTNPGEPLQPLHKVVSGGELSRIMLAIKTIMADRDETETLIFDEIDTGISGRTAQKVAEKMCRIGKNHQVICITHLAQIASMADHHFVITKGAENGETISHIHELDEEASAEELARILGGAEITESVRKSAEEMKKLAEKRKKEVREKTL